MLKTGASNLEAEAECASRPPTTFSSVIFAFAASPPWGQREPADHHADRTE